MKIKLIIFFCIFYIALFSFTARFSYAVVECHGNYTDTSSQATCQSAGNYWYCSWTYPVSSNDCETDTHAGPNTAVCHSSYLSDDTCTGGLTGCTITDGGGNFTQSGCWTCDTNECKPGTTSYTQSCGSTTLNYSCTNECGGTKSWTGVGSCKECKTDTNCGLNPRDCGADYCQHCARTVSDWTPACGDQTRTCTDNDGSCDGDDCLGVSLSQCQECRTISPWSSCGDDHKRTRTCTDYCGGCVGVDLVGIS